MVGELLHDSWQTARKEHRCSLCCEPINPGDRYYRQHCADGEFRWSFKAHDECESAARWGCNEFDYSMEEVPVDDPRLFIEEFLTPYRAHMSAPLGSDDS